MLLLLQTDCVWASECITSLLAAALPQFAAGQSGTAAEGAASAATTLLQQEHSSGKSFFGACNSSSSSSNNNTFDTGFACKLLRGLELLQQTPQLWGGGGAQQQLQQQIARAATTSRGLAAVRVQDDLGCMVNCSSGSTGSRACVEALLPLGAAFLAAAPVADLPIGKQIVRRVRMSLLLLQLCCSWLPCCAHLAVAAAAAALTAAAAAVPVAAAGVVVLCLPQLLRLLQQMPRLSYAVTPEGATDAG